MYINNLIQSLLTHKHQISFLSYGYKNNPLRCAPYIKKSFNPYTKKGCQSFDLINSPVVAPSRFHTSNPLLSITPQEKLEKCIKKFVVQQGGFDVIHFHSLEGITPQVLKSLKESFPGTKIFYSGHDYHPFCIGIRLYQEGACRHCNHYNEGASCVRCISEFPKELLYRHVHHYYCDPYNKIPIPGFLRKALIRRSIKKSYARLHQQQGKANDYQAYRKTFIEFINNHVDGVLAVSQRVGEIYAKLGIKAELITTSYIGTKVADQQVGHQSHPPSSQLTLLFMGIASAPEKGFSFLEAALNKIPENTAKKLNIIIAARGANPQSIKEKLNHFNSCKVHDGYTHDQLPEIMQSVDLGIVPVLWEDNLPQVAIEMVAHGVPILCSDMGGASELCDGEDFKFKAGDEADLIQKLTNFVERPELLYRYWEHHRGLTTMQQHVEQLESIYQQKTS